MFTAFGLSGGAFLGTEAASALMLYISKVSTFAVQDALPLPVALKGLLVGAGIMLGTAAGKPLVLRMPAWLFSKLIDLLLSVSGAALLYSAWSG